MVTASTVFYQQNGDVTKRYYEQLSSKGPLGQVAVCLFRAQKRSCRAKDYRSRKWRNAAYDVKSWSISELCRVLAQHAGALGITYGWKQDPNVVFGLAPSWVLYCDLPGIGQVSFHSPTRGAGPSYPKDWDGQKISTERILLFADRAMNGK